MKIEQLPILAGQILKRLGKPSVLDIDEDTFTRLIEAEQAQRTRERKAAQIARAQKKTRKETPLQVSIVSQDD